MTQSSVILSECSGVTIGIIGGSGLYGIEGIKVIGGASCKYFLLKSCLSITSPYIERDKRQRDLQHTIMKRETMLTLL